MLANVDTGVSWCKMQVTPELSELVSRTRANECALHELLVNPEDMARFLITADVDAAAALAATPSIPMPDLLQRCFDLKGKPYDQAPARRDMRERIRIWRRLTQGKPSVPHSVDELFELWTEAVLGEYPVYRESQTACFRTRIPFVDHIGATKPTTIAPEKETIAPDQIADQTNALLSFLSRTDIAPELHAGAAVFAFLYIHPFRDGNGHTHRMLACSMLSGLYSPATLLAFVRTRQANRSSESLLIGNIVRDRTDIGIYAQFMLEQLSKAQDQLLLRCHTIQSSRGIQDKDPVTTGDG